MNCALDVIDGELRRVFKFERPEELWPVFKPNARVVAGTRSGWGL